MRIPQRLLIACLFLGLAGCATPPQAPQQAEAPQTPAAPDEETPENLPQVELSASLLYKLLVAEFAAREGQVRLSADAYLKSAQETRDPRLARRATQAALYARDGATALTAANLWVELQPENIDARQSLAALLIRSGQNDKAIPHLEMVMAYSPPNSPGHGYQMVANLLASSDNPQQALQTMEQLRTPYRDDPQALYAHAQLAHELNENETAGSLLQQLLEQQPGQTDALILQSRVSHALGRQQEALDSLHQALELKPDNDNMRLTYARMLVDANQLKAARRQFQILNKRLPDNTDVTYALGLLAMEAGDIDAAEPHFLELLRRGERGEEASLALGQIAQLQGKPQEAIDWYRSVPQGERYMEAQLLAAQLMAEEDGVDAALEYLQQLPLDSDEERIQRSMVKAELLAAEERYDEAMTVYDEALTEFGDNTQLLYSRALTAEKFGRIDLLERDLKRILELDPDNSQALNALGYTLADRTDRYEEAYRYIEKAYTLEPGEPAILDSMGWILYRMGRHEEAIDFLRRAAKELPRDPEVAAHLGEVLWISGQKEEARQVWGEALKLSPDHKILNQTVERFNP